MKFENPTKPIILFAIGLTLLSGQSSFAQSAGDIQASLARSSNGGLKSFYQARRYQPLFMNNGMPTQKAFELRNAVSTISAHGLPATDYWGTSEESIISGASSIAAVDAELKLAGNFVAAAEHIAVGRINPESVSPEIKYQKRNFSESGELGVNADYSELSSLLERLAPENDYYRSQVEILRRLRAASFAAIYPPQMTLRVGVKSPIVRSLKARASAMGYPISSNDDTYDSDLSRAVLDIQKHNLTRATGVLTPSDSNSWEFFSISSARRIQQVEMNMEKLRWLPSEMEARHIFVNLANQRMKIQDLNLSNPLLAEQNVVAGRPDRQTPLMREDLEFVVFNPTWTIPPDIYRLDKVPAIQQASVQGGPEGVRNWFTTNRMKLLDRREQIVDPGSYDWINNPPRFGNVLIRQQPGTDNALGTMKFMMPNPYSIYLHDTNQPELLNNDMRLLSSGCIRLQYPREFAEYLLSGTRWNRPTIDSFVVKPGETRESESWIRLPNRVSVPVYLTSITSNLGDDGVMRFTRDIYKQNAEVLKVLKANGFYR